VAAHVYKTTRGRVPSVTTILGKYRDADGLLMWARAEWEAGRGLHDVRDDAAVKGTWAHQIIELELRGLTVPDEQVQSEIAEAIAAFREWRAFVGPMQVLAIETPMVSEAWHFGGCPDLVADFGQGPEIVDWKRKRKHHADTLVQVGGYALLWEETAGVPVVGGRVVRLADGGDEWRIGREAVVQAKASFVLRRQAYESDRLLGRLAGKPEERGAAGSGEAA
jgi:hypothetical protein